MERICSSISGVRPLPLRTLSIVLKDMDGSPPLSIR